jgi:2'-5' RNA ligase
LEAPKPSSAVLRLFIAITVPGTIRAELARAQSELRKSVGNARITWTQPEQFHLTLRFLGKVDVVSLEALGNALKEACHGFGPLSMRAQGLGCFPNFRRPHVIWVGLHDAGQRLVGLQGAIRDATQRFTAEAGEKSLSGHITLGRIKAISASQRGILSRELARKSAAVWGEWRASSVELIRSELSENGAQHTRLLEVALEG